MTEQEDSNGTPSTTQIMYNYEFIDDFDKPQLGTLGNFLLNRVLRYKSKSQESDIPLVMINHQSENGQLPSTSTSSIKPAQQSIVMPSEKNWGPKVYDKDNHTMHLMVNYKMCADKHYSILHGPRSSRLCDFGGSTKIENLVFEGCFRCGTSTN